jgi:hypothetical protein
MMVTGIIRHHLALGIAAAKLTAVVVVMDSIAATPFYYSVALETH